MADSSNHIYYYLYNLQGDVIALADSATGKLVATYAYDAWGKIVKINDLAPNDVAETSIAKINPFRYRGYYYDSESDLYYLNSRYYDAETDRFINADVFTSTDFSGVLSTNMFAYCENNPVMREDQTGEIWGKVAKVAVGAAIGGIVNAVCTATHGGSFREVAGAFAIGALEGVVSSVFKHGRKVVAAIETVKTVYECRKAGASWGESILAGSFSLYSSFFYTKSDSLIANTVCDLTLGLGVSLLSTGLTKQIKEKNKPKPTKKRTTSYYSSKSSGNNYRNQYRFATGPR